MFDIGGLAEQLPCPTDILLDARATPVHVTQREQGIRIAGGGVTLDDRQRFSSAALGEKRVSISQGRGDLLHSLGMATKAKAFHI